MGDVAVESFAEYQPGDIVEVSKGGVIFAKTQVCRIKNHSMRCKEAGEEQKITKCGTQFNFYAKLTEKRETVLRDVTIRKANQ